jgi:hypothetical protein
MMSVTAGTGDDIDVPDWDDVVATVLLPQWALLM